MLFGTLELIVYSDYGQERTESFERRNGRSLQAALSEVFAEGSTAGLEVWQSPPPVRELMGQTVERCEAFLGLKRDETKESRFVPDADNQIVLTAMGPIGHIYLPRDLSDSEKANYARRLVAAGVPLVLIRNRDGLTLACPTRYARHSRESEKPPARFATPRKRRVEGQGRSTT